MKSIIKEKGSVYFNGNSWEKLQELLNELNPTKIFILTDNNTQQYCSNVLISKISFNRTPVFLIIPAGEKNKTIETCLTLWNSLSDNGADRSSLLINLGGGMITDLGGFVASTFKRGISFINIPTSLLAMVDASIGGKNGIDLGVIKNQIGVINNAESVIIDTNFLNTLPKNELTSGYAEMLKHGLIYSKEYWESLKFFDSNNPTLIEDAIWKSIKIKNEIVTIDPTEKYERKALNYGHTLGHAIESFFLEHQEKTTLLHGEAIAIGMILANYISSELEDFPKQERDNTTRTILEKFSKISFTEPDITAIISLLKYDKKNKDGVVLFVLLSDFGKFKTDCVVPNKLTISAFRYYQEFQTKHL